MIIFIFKIESQPKIPYMVFFDCNKMKNALTNTIVSAFCLQEFLDFIELGAIAHILGVEFGLVAFAFLSDNYPHVLIGRLR